METDPEIAVVSNDSSCSDSFFLKLWILTILKQHNPHLCYGMQNKLRSVVFIKMTKDSVDFTARNLRQLMMKSGFVTLVWEQ